MKLENKKLSLSFTAKQIVDHKMPKINTDKWDKRKVQIGGQWTEVASRNNGSYFVMDNTNFYVPDAGFKNVKSVSIVKVETKQKLDAKPAPKKEEPKGEDSQESPKPRQLKKLENLGDPVIEAPKLEEIFTPQMFDVVSKEVLHAGTYDPSDMDFTAKGLSVAEQEFAEELLFWMYGEGKTFNRSNYKQVVKEFVDQK